MIKLTLTGLILLFIVIVMLSYFKVREGFEDATKEIRDVSTVATELEQNLAPVPVQPVNIPPSPTADDASTLQQKAELLKDIQKIVKNEIIAQRAVDPILPTASGVQSQASIANEQGKEFKPCPNMPGGGCPAMPDMSQYIRKDAIPCWNCTLDY